MSLSAEIYSIPLLSFHFQWVGIDLFPLLLPHELPIG